MSRFFGKKDKSKLKGDPCGFCRVIIAKDDRHSGKFYSVAPSGDDEGGMFHTVRARENPFRPCEPFFIAIGEDRC